MGMLGNILKAAKRPAAPHPMATLPAQPMAPGTGVEKMPALPGGVMPGSRAAAAPAPQPAPAPKAPKLPGFGARR